MAKKTNPTLFGRFQRFRGKGQHDTAIEELQNAIEQDPENMRLMHRLGDLYAKAEYVPDAIEAYLRVAESYTEDAHYQKALAVYKQILRLDETRTDVQMNLAQVYVSLDRRGDALSQYQNLAFLFEQEGDLGQAIIVYQSMLSLDPHNIPLHVKLAELHLAQQNPNHAVEEFEKALRELANEERWGDYLKVGERLLFIDPNNMEVLKKLSSIYLQHNEVMKAVAKLQIAYKHNRRDAETLELLVQAFMMLRQPPKALSVLQQLAEVYQNNKDVLGARKAYERILELNPNDAAARQVYEELQRAPTPSPQHEGFSNSASNMSAATHSSTSLNAASSKNQEHLEKLLAEAEVFQKYGLANRVLEKLQQLLTINTRYGPARKMRAEILLSREDYAQAAEDFWIAAQNLPPAEALPCLERILEITEAPPQLQENAYQVLVRLRQQHPELAAEEIPSSSLAESFGDLPAIQNEDEEEDIISVDDGDISVEDDIAMEDDIAVVEDADAFVVEEEHEEAFVVEDDIAVVEDADEFMVEDDSDQTGEGLTPPPTPQASYQPPAFSPPPPPAAPSFGFAPPPPAPAPVNTFSPPPPPAAPKAFSPPPPPAAPKPFSPPAPPAAPRGFEPPPPTASKGFIPPHPTGFSAPKPPPKPSSFSGGGDLDDLEAQAARLEAMIKAKEEEDSPAPTPAAPTAPAPQMPRPPAPWLDSSPVEPPVAPAPPPAPWTAAETATPPPPAPWAKAEAPATPPAPAPWAKADTPPAPEPIAAEEEDLSTLDQPGDALQGQDEDFEELDEDLIIEEQLSPIAEKLEEAALYLEQEEYTYALELYDQILSEDPQNREALQGRDQALSALQEQEFDLEKQLEEGGDFLLDLDSALGFVEDTTPHSQRARDRVAEEIKQFQQAVQQSVSDDEGDTHFELGIAFQGMGLYSQAVEEFQTCLRIGYREADCYKMIGNSYAAQGKMKNAVEVYAKALDLPSLDPNDRLDLLYEIAQAHEQSGNPQGALQCFEEVYMIDQSYRGVSGRVQQLRSLLGV